MAKSKSTRARRRAKPATDDAKAYEDFRKQPAQLTDEQFFHIEKLFREDAGGPEGYGPWRRSGLASLTRSVQQLMDSMADDAETAQAMASVAVNVETYAKRLESLVEMLKAASFRIEMALCVREDMRTILEMARTNLPDDSESRVQ